MFTPPYSASWSGATQGHHLLQVKATDENQQRTTSRPVGIDVVETGGSLAVSLAPTTGNVNLTTEGIADWKLFGLIEGGLIRSPMLPQ